MRIAIVGAGAMGSLFGSRLAASGHDVGLIDVARAHIDAINRAGVRLTSASGEEIVSLRAGVAADFDAVADLLILFTKTVHSAAALNSARHLIGPLTLAMTLQNGLGNGERLAHVVSQDRIAIGVTNWPADMRAPGHVASHGTGEVRLWSIDGHAHDWIFELAKLLSSARLNAFADVNVNVRVWEKVAFNAAMNSIAAVSRLPVGAMADSKDGRALAMTVVDEVVAVARAQGVAVDAARIMAGVEIAFSEHRDHKPSMLQDILAGRPTEIEAINGAIVAAAAGSNIEVRTVKTLAHLVRMAELQNREART